MAAANSLFKAIKLNSILEQPVPEKRIPRLKELSEFISKVLEVDKEVHLNFICTHNSRRSHLAQIWAQTMAYYHGIENVYCYSAGTEQTAMNHQIVSTLRNQGFKIDLLNEGPNPKYEVKFTNNQTPILAYSKTINQQDIAKSFAAIMTCSDADENCPFIPGCTQRIALNYEDPKKFDNTDLAEAKYLERSQQIASEMNWVFNKIKPL